MEKKLVPLLFVLIYGCVDTQNNTDESLYVEVSNEIGINFSNDLTPTEEFNPYIFRSFYNGGGVAIGDVDNNGFQDIYFTGNQVDNQLFLNMGDWQFLEIAKPAGVACENIWSTGASFVDVNQDGWLDLYVCKSGAPGGKNRANSLFINNKDGTFTDMAKQYGLDVEGLSVQAAFFDYDKDGDYDCYLLTNSIRSVGTGADLRKNSREVADDGGNKLFRNDEGKFVDVAAESGIYSSSIGFGLGITLGDFNYDDWPDIFISNDFFEKDYLYINNQDGSFTEQLEKYFRGISLGSMGADMSDINNDGYSDLLVTEMLPEGLARKKTKTMYESWNKQQLSIKNGFYKQFPRNMLHLGLSDNAFTEAGRISGIANTEWSWGALLFDMDNDAMKDAFISNGIYIDLLDRDFLSFTANEANIRKLIKSSDNAILQLLEKMPSEPVKNSAFKNNGDLSFENVSDTWGFSSPSFSNGSAYVDLDNDHDLDLVISNVNSKAFVYRNNTSGNGISIKLIDSLAGTGIGARVSVKIGSETLFHENFPVKGYQSASTPIVHFGLGDKEKVDLIEVLWPSGKKNILKDVDANQLITITEIDAQIVEQTPTTDRTEKVTKTKIPDLDFIHIENQFVDFDRNNLLPEMYSNLGTRVATADLNGDGVSDFYFGGAKNQAGILLQSSGSGYTSQQFDAEVISEDVDATFFDADNDGDLDLYVASGGTEYSASSTALLDRLYINNDGEYSISTDAIPNTFKISTSFVTPFDFDQDGDIDLLVGQRFHPTNYGTSGSISILENKDGTFIKSENHNFDEIKSSSLITDGQWLDVNQDGLMDIVVVGEWSPIYLYLNENGQFVHRSKEYNLSGTEGWWNTLEVEDLNDDGYLDLIAGNKGKNSFFKKGTRLNTHDFDKNGFIDNLISIEENGKHYPVHDKDELISHFPALKKRAIYYSDYASKTSEELFGTELLNESLETEIKMIESSVFYGSENGFQRAKLPEMVQLSPIYAIEITDINKDGWKDLVVGGNQEKVKPQFGSYDALNGTILFGSDNGFENENIYVTDIKGQVRDIELFENKGEHLLFFINNDSIQIRSFN